MNTIPAYTPRWLSRFFGMLNNLPIPFWVVALVYASALAVIRHWIAWQRGLIPQGEWSAFLVVNPVFSLAIIIAWQYLDRRALRALAAFYAESGKSRKAVAEVTSQFLSLPAKPATLAFALGLVAGYIGFLDAPQRLEPAAAQVWPAVSILGFALTLGFLFLIVYRLIHQIRLMRRMFNDTPADIFNPSAVYALSSYGAAFALSVLIAFTLPSLPIVNLFSTASGQFSLVVVGLGVLVIFFAPLMEINARMRATKQGLLARIGNNLRELTERLNKSLEGRKFAEVDKLRGSLSALREERELVQKIPTWPWQPETLRNLLAPMLIPVMVYLIQRFIGSALGF